MIPRKAFLTLLLSLSAILSAAPTDDGLYAVFDTNRGEFTAELFYKDAPLSCANLIGLAEGILPHYPNGQQAPVFSNFYDNLTFHRIVAGFVIQGGDPSGDGTGGPGYDWPDEVSPDLSHSSEGILSMANAGINTNGSQFFITLAPTLSLNGKHNVFGRIVEGIENVRVIGATATDARDAPISAVTINSIRALRIGAEAEAFDPTFYAELFNPNGLQVAQAIEPKLTFQHSDTEQLTVSAPYQPFTDYRFSVSQDLEAWTSEDLIFPSLDPNIDSIDYQLLPSPESTPRFVRMAGSSGPLLDLEGKVTQIRVDSASGGAPFQETITINPNLTGVYQSSANANLDVSYRWVTIGPRRTQLTIQFANSARVAFYLDSNEDGTGSAYIRDGDFIGQGTYTLTFPTAE